MSLELSDIGKNIINETLNDTDGINEDINEYTNVDNESNEDQSEGQTIGLELSDVIDIIAPSNEMLNDKRFIIDYIDENKIILIDLNKFNKVQLNIDENGILDNNSITEIHLINRNEDRGYARQNGLLPGTWVNIHFGGDIPSIITGEITNLEEDMIEVTTYPEKRVIYFPFNYKGLPENLPIEMFEIRAKPEKSKEVSGEQGEQSEQQDFPENNNVSEEKEEQDQSIDESMDDSAELEEIETNAAMITNASKELEEMIIDADQLKLGEIHEPFIQYVDIDVEQKRYNIEIQANDLLDVMLSNVPTNKRTYAVLNNIHTLIERFKQLRTDYSIFDKNGVIKEILVKTHLHKPLKQRLFKNDVNMYWLLFSAKNEKKIYNVLNDGKWAYYTPTPEDVPDIDMIDQSASLTQLSTIIDENFIAPVTADQNKYYNLYNDVNPYFTPFNDVNVSMETNNMIIQQKVKYDINVIINNYKDDFMSSVINGAELIRKPFVMNKYCTGLTYLESAITTKTSMDPTVGNLTPNDKIAITSIITLPEPAIKFSKINLPGTNILDSANLNTTFLYYWKLFGKNTNINNVIVNVDGTGKVLTDKEMLLEEKKERETSYKTYFDNINNFTLDVKNSNTDEEASQLSRSDIYKNFLEKIIPTTKDLFNIMSKYIVGKVSLVDIVDVLEPFCIYPNDLTYKQYQTINQFIDCRISKYNKLLIERRKDINKLNKFKETNKNIFAESKRVVNLLEENNSLSRTVFESYKYLDEKNSFLSSSELIKKILLNDYGYIFFNAISLINIKLTYPISFAPLLNKDKNDFNGIILKDKENNKCVNYVIAKKYKVKTEIDADNGLEIYYDKEFDKTPYEFLDDFSKEINRMSKEDFNEFLIGKLVSKYKYSEADAREHAESLMAHHKKVRDGDYAIFFNSVQNKLEFFLRQDNIWVLDENVTKDLFLNDTSLLCNMQATCYSQADNACDDIQTNKDMIKQKALKSIIDQFDVNYQATQKELFEKLQVTFEYYNSIIGKLDEIKNYKHYYNNNAKYEIGLKITDSADAIVSPYAKYKDIILGEQNIPKKNSDIITFAKLCTRAPLTSRLALQTENEHWLYCNKTDVPLLPSFYLELAIVFNTNNSEYMNTLQKIVKERGALSDDGDKIVDKYSGETITLIDFSSEEGYTEEGFQMRSRDILEEDWADLKTTSQSPQVPVSPETKMIHNIVNAISNVIGFRIPGQMEFIVRNVKNTMNDIMPSEDVIREKNDDLEKKGKSITSYEDTRSAILLYLTLGMYIIAVQTNIPSISTRKTFTGCNRSFEGFPINSVSSSGSNNRTFINYLACIAYKIRTSSSPWKVLLKKKEDYIAETIYAYINNYLIINPEIIQTIKTKQNYLQDILTGAIHEDILEEFSILRMTTFLPPLKLFTVPNLNTVSSDFAESLLTNLQTGSYKQYEQIFVLESKIIAFSYAIQEEIQKIIVQVITKNIKKPSQLNLLINYSSQLALENSCCNEEQNNSVLQYFKNKNENIERYNDIVSHYAGILDDIKYKTNARIFCGSNVYKIHFANTDVAFSKHTIYKAFIVYCKFNSIIPMSPELRVICKSKPENFIKGDSIDEQIKKLESDGRSYNGESMNELLRIVGANNIVNTKNNTVVLTKLQKLRILFDNIYTTNKQNVVKIVPEQFTQYMKEIIDMGVNGDEAEEIRILQNFLLKINGQMKKNIISFITKNSQITQKQVRSLTLFFDTIMNWGSENNRVKISDENMYNSINFIKTYLHNFIKIFPNTILTETNYNILNTKLPNHWHISPRDDYRIKDFIREYYAALQKFYGNASLTNVLNEIQTILEIILNIADETPSCSNINDNDKDINKNNNPFDKRTSLYLFEYYFLTTLNTYVQLTDKSKRITQSKQIVTLENIYSTSFNQSVEDFENAEYDTYASELNEGQNKDIKLNVATLLLSYIELMENHKITVNLSYEFIMNSVFKIQQTEKKTFTDKLAALRDEEREVDTIFKINKLGDWNKGLQKGLTTYNKNDDDDTIKQNNENYQRLERKLMRNQNVNDSNFEQYREDLEEDNRVAEEIDAEEFGLGNMDEDYYDGNPYGDEETD
jgi:hypothetical protein